MGDEGRSPPGAEGVPDVDAVVRVVGICVVCPRNFGEASVAEVQWTGGRMVGYKVQTAGDSDQ